MSSTLARRSTTTRSSSHSNLHEAIPKSSPTAAVPLPTSKRRILGRPMAWKAFPTNSSPTTTLLPFAIPWICMYGWIQVLKCLVKWRLWVLISLPRDRLFYPCVIKTGLLLLVYGWATVVVVERFGNLVLPPPFVAACRKTENATTGVAIPNKKDDDHHKAKQQQQEQQDPVVLPHYTTNSTLFVASWWPTHTVWSPMVLMTWTRRVGYWIKTHGMRILLQGIHIVLALVVWIFFCYALSMIYILTLERRINVANSTLYWAVLGGMHQGGVWMVQRAMRPWIQFLASLWTVHCLPVLQAHGPARWMTMPGAPACCGRGSHAASSLDACY